MSTEYKRLEDMFKDMKKEADNSTGSESAVDETKNTQTITIQEESSANSQSTASSNNKETNITTTRQRSDSPRARAKRNKEAVNEQACRELAELVAKNPEIAERLSIYSKKVELVNTLGFADSGNSARETGEDGKTRQTPTTAIVGYTFRNNSEDTIPYRTKEYIYNSETGEYEGSECSKNWIPGEVIALTKIYTTMLLMGYEFSCEVANGYLKKTSKTNIDTKEEFLGAFAFAFWKEENKQVGADNVQINISKQDPVSLQWTVLDEYAKTFGFLNKKRKRTNPMSDKFEGLQIMAQHIRTQCKRYDK